MFDLFSKKFDPRNQILDLTGKVAVETDSNAGQGFHIAEYLALNGAKVYSCGRTREKTQAAFAKFNGLHPEHKVKGELIRLALDLVDPRNAGAAANAILQREKRLDIFVQHAQRVERCVPTIPFELTPDGIETLVAINYIGHFVFTNLLLPLLQRTAELPNSDVRVITVSSSNHTSPTSVDLTSETAFQLTQGKPDTVNIDRFLTTIVRYGYTKLLNVPFANELQHHVLAPDKKTVTNLPLQIFSTSQFDGAATTLVATTAPVVRQKADRYFGFYLNPGGAPGNGSDLSLDAGKARELWDLRENAVADVLKGDR